jgi:hypothetical protein
MDTLEPLWDEPRSRSTAKLERQKKSLNPLTSNATMLSIIVKMTALCVRKCTKSQIVCENNQCRKRIVENCEITIKNIQRESVERLNTLE